MVTAVVAEQRGINSDSDSGKNMDMATATWCRDDVDIGGVGNMEATFSLHGSNGGSGGGARMETATEEQWW